MTSPVNCCACGAEYKEDGDLYFHRVGIIAKSNEIPQVTMTCHKCLQLYHSMVIPAIIKMYMEEAKNSDQGGKKFDSEKARTDLLSTEALLQIAEVMGAGAKKYGAQNWRQGIEWSRVYAAVQRHLLAWNAGETFDPETGLNHLAHAGCGIMFLLEYAKTHGELDDRYKKD